MHPVRMSQGTVTGSNNRTCAGCDAIKSEGTLAVAMHFDAVIIRRVTYASLLIFHPSSFHPDWRLSRIFKCILRCGSLGFLLADARRKKRRGIFPPPLSYSNGGWWADNVSEKHSTVAQMYSAAERFRENPISPYRFYLANQMRVHTVRLECTKSIRINLD